MQLLSTFPKLYTDLKEGKTNTLKDFVVDMRHVPVKYGFAAESSTRTTDLSVLTKEQLRGLPNRQFEVRMKSLNLQHSCRKGCKVQKSKVHSQINLK